MFIIVFISSKNLHNEAVSCILNSSIKLFYSRTPKEFLDSFSLDVFQIDEFLTAGMAKCSMFGLMILGYIAYMIYIIPANLSIIGIFIILSGLFTYFSIKSLTKLKRNYLESSAPITKIFQEAITGITEIRSLRIQGFFHEKFLKKNNALGQSYLNFIYFCRFYMLVISMSAALALSLNVFFIQIFLDQTGSYLGSVSLTFNIAIMSYLPWFFRELIDLISLSSSLQRLGAFLNLEKEPSTGETLKVTNGKIEFKNVEMIYPGYLEIALHDVSFCIEGGQKFGIIGRSGSGKTSVFNVLFRLNRINTGWIKIDDQDISKVSIKSLRTAISIIPQTPFLFSGSIKSNLDPFGFVCDEELNRILKTVELSEVFLINGLESDISSLELSVGQKQLFALARVLVQNNKILVLDEATSFVDSTTESHMQDIIDDVFNGKTIISIAHKLQLVMRYDLVLFMDNGHVIDILPPNQVMTRDPTRFVPRVLEDEDID